MGEHKTRNGIKGDGYKEKQSHKINSKWINIKPDDWYPGMKYVIQESDETWMVGEHGELISMNKIHYKKEGK
jgi:hypothetical protein